MEKTSMFPKFDQRLAKYGGKYYFQKMTKSELREKKDKAIVLAEGIHTEDQLSDLLSKENGIRDPVDSVQWKFILIPDYQPGKGAIVMKFHHCFIDGGAISMFLLAVSGKYDPKHLPGMKERSLLQ